MLTEYFEVIGAIAAQFNVNWPLLAGVFTRMSAIAFLAPAIGELAVSPRVRLAAAAALTMIVAPGLSHFPPPDGGPAMLASMLGGEALSGLIIGFALRLTIFALQMFGAIAAQAMSLSQLFGPGLGHDQESPISTILIAAGLALACAGGAHIQLAQSASETYQVLPLGAFPAAGESAEFATAQGAKALSLAFGLAAPFVLLGIAYSVALGAANKAMPQMAAVFVGAPAIVVGGLTLFAASGWVILSRWSELSADLFASPLSGLP
jgi:flagellar biosynthetic protein FliR